LQFRYDIDPEGTGFLTPNHELYRKYRLVDLRKNILEDIGRAHYKKP